MARVWGYMTIYLRGQMHTQCQTNTTTLTDRRFLSMHKISMNVLLGISLGLGEIIDTLEEGAYYHNGWT